MSLVGDVIGGLFGSGTSAQKKNLKAQGQLAKQQAGMFKEVSPYYSQILQYLQQNAGLGGRPGGIMGGGLGSRVGALGARRPGPAQMGGPALQNNQLGIYGSNPADVFRLQQAEEDIGRQAQLGGSQLAHRLGAQGIGGSTLAAALGQNQQSAQGQYAGFRRQLAMNAQQEQERRVQQFLASLGPGLGGGANAAAQLGNIGQQAGQMASQAGGNLGQLAQAYMMLQRPRSPGGGGGGGYPQMGAGGFGYGTGGWGY